MAAISDLVVGLARKREGKLVFVDRRAFDQAVLQLPDDWTFEISVKRQQATRSAKANAYYWGVVIALLVRHCDNSYTPDELHEICKAKFLPKLLAVCDGNGEVVCEYVFGGSTRRLNTEQFMDYVEQIRQWCAETLGLDIPDPDSEYEAEPTVRACDVTSKTTWYRAKRRRA